MQQVNHMEKTLQWILWFSLIQIFLKLGDSVIDGRKLLVTNDDTHPDFISIDCGASNEYTDTQTGIWYQTDTSFVETGTNHMVESASRSDLNYLYFGRQLQTLRSFSEGKRNCYTLKPKQGEHNKYLIRAFFSYGNYDSKNQTPTFDLYLGVTFWSTVDLGDNYYDYKEIIHSPTTDTIHVCLLNTGKGIPFISTLELRPLSNSIYPTLSPSHQSLLDHQASLDIGSTSLVTHSRCL
ncbi:probable LRR receptor-like serine/threonine-protein kinase At4g29180 [Prosopis cineraria]|uniref:probable LRR receptor-like serine/threonine-protein kinase At4g29180 n=1 Tax=Prosopis cineraria TaxID=364024 RepID=UPI00240F5D38|nr:probable LRR receptor-like serine/threonine-protein kinase At4g29180 [Prosopis cineraria]